jgi:hypothetical protein
MMKKFLLLRSNKQSGPYSADELQQMGLKAYDLIWVDGKSAAWRYPGEVEELKAFAPPVEEQPYDRFYKKPEENKVQESKVQENKVQETRQPEQASTSIITPQKSEEPQPSKKDKEYKRIFVTLPNGNSAAVPQQPATPRPVAQQPTQVFGEALTQENSYQYQQPASELPKPNPIKTKPRVEKEAVANEEVYYPKSRSKRMKPLVLAGIITGMVAMVALGIFIGINLNKKEGVSLIKKVDRVDKPNANNQPNSNTNTAANQANINPDPLVGEVDKPKDEAATEPVIPVVKKKPVVAADSNHQEMAVNVPPKNETEAIVEKKEEQVNKPAPKPTVPNLEKLVAVSSNEYQVGPFGGISKLELTVKNTSDYDLNLVVVQVDYLKVNKEVFKTENIYFRDIGANSSVTLEAPRSTRGNKVNYKVTLINSKDHLYHAGN